MQFNNNDVALWAAHASRVLANASRGRELLFKPLDPLAAEEKEKFVSA